MDYFALEGWKGGKLIILICTRQGQAQIWSRLRKQRVTALAYIEMLWQIFWFKRRSERKTEPDLAHQPVPFCTKPCHAQLPKLSVWLECIRLIIWNDISIFSPYVVQGVVKEFRDLIQIVLKASASFSQKKTWWWGPHSMRCVTALEAHATGSNLGISSGERQGSCMRRAIWGWVHVQGLLAMARLQWDLLCPSWWH